MDVITLGLGIMFVVSNVVYGALCHIFRHSIEMEELDLARRQYPGRFN